MQVKNYQDYTIKELIDLGLEVSVKADPVNSLNEAIDLLTLFEGTARSTNQTLQKITAQAWGERFNFSTAVR